MFFPHPLLSKVLHVISYITLYLVFIIQVTLYYSPCIML